MSVTIRAHYDGRVIVPDETVELPVNQPLQLRLVEAEGDADAGLLPEAERERRKAAWEEFLSRAVCGPDIPLDVIRRENMYEDRL